MKTIKKYLSSVVVGLAVTACQPEIESPITSGNQIDLSRYVAVGNSLTAGYMDGGLYNEAMDFSYPNLMAKQFQRVGGGDFIQAYFPDDKPNGTGFLKVTGFTSLGTPILGSETDGVVPPTELPTSYSGPLPNNLGVPGIAVAHLNDPNYNNPLFLRLKNSVQGASTYLDLVEEADPTFFTCWLGNNDVLGFVTQGGEAPITPTALFQANFQALVDKLTANGAKGVIAEIPNVTSIPYVYAPNALIRQQNNGDFPVIPLDATAAALLNGLYEANGYSNPGFQAGNNFPVIVVDDPDTPEIEVRRMNPSQDFLLFPFLPMAGEIATGLGWARDTNGDGIPDTPSPIADNMVLDAAELMQAITAVNTFNNIIRTLANNKNIPVINTTTILTQIIPGTVIEGVQVSGAPFSGGFFSVDQIHPTPRGYAIIANIMLRHINQTYGARIPLIDINALNPRVVAFP